MTVELSDDEAEDLAEFLRGQERVIYGERATASSEPIEETEAFDHAADLERRLMSEDPRDRLREAARERYGDEWFLRVTEHADGDRYVEAVHTVEVVADGLVIRDFLRIGEDGDIERTRSLVEVREFVADIDTDDTED